MTLLKLSDEQYRLPIIEALTPFSTFESGTTRPFGIMGIDRNSGESGQYVVKCMHSSRMSLSSSAFELIAAWMAMELELPVAEPCLIHLTNEFVQDTMRGHDAYAVAQESIGLNFGCQYYEGYSPLPPHETKFSPELIQIIKLLYTFDVFISNADRGHQKPNILSNGKRFLLFDHELAFSFLSLFSFSRNPTPWIFNEGDRTIYEHHVFFNYLRKHKPDFSEEVLLLKRFDNLFWEKAMQQLPSAWKTEKTEEIPLYLTRIVENLDTFANSLNQTLLP